MDKVHNDEEKLSKQLTVKFTDEDYNKIKRMAKDKQRKISDLIRLIVKTYIEQSEKLN